MWKYFGEWGELESCNVVMRLSIAFPRFRLRTSAEFAKEAMACQPLDQGEILSIRWAHDDPNPVAQVGIDDAMACKPLLPRLIICFLFVYRSVSLFHFLLNIFSVDFLLSFHRPISSFITDLTILFYFLNMHNCIRIIFFPTNSSTPIIHHIGLNSPSRQRRYFCTAQSQGSVHRSRSLRIPYRLPTARVQAAAAGEWGRHHISTPRARVSGYGCPVPSGVSSCGGWCGWCGWSRISAYS